VNGRGRSAFQIAAGLSEDGDYLDGTGEQEAEFLAKASWHDRHRYEVLKREWERWRYRRSKLTPGERGSMLRVGERECRECGVPFEPSTLRQHHCSPTCRKAAHKRRRGGGVLDHSGSRVTSPAPPEDAAFSVTPAGKSPPICGHCQNPITKARRSTRAYCSAACRQAAYRERLDGEAS
jgi:hypothetical protein